ncbi:MAG: fumarylacetoacetate hydrolase family protein [Proteobacteria bacterium]|nr:fumarylacetoacetate hydrolase family protein [Pseudomonadota bacterium]
MKFASFSKDGKASYGAVTKDGIVDLGRRLNHADLKAVIAAGAIDEARKAADGQAADMPVESVTLLPPIPNPSKIICIGLNYHDHRKETGRTEETANPTLFTRFADTQIGHGQAMILPMASEQLDFEGELALVIGKEARHVSQANALSHIAGYTCFNDGSVRDWQFHTTQFVPGKNFPATGGCGPWMVTADEVPDPSKLTLTTRLNGKQVQHSPTDMLIFPIPRLIEYISTFTTLRPGDLIVTGTPGGVGAKRTPPLWMKAGDKVEVEITGVGTLVNTIAAER